MVVLVPLGGSLVDDLFDRRFQRRAEWARLIALWVGAGSIGWGCCAAAAVIGVRSGPGVLLLSLGLLVLAVCASQTFSYRRTQDRRPRAHDARRTQPDR
jgi:hypothetical protein